MLKLIDRFGQYQPPDIWRPINCPVFFVENIREGNPHLQFWKLIAEPRIGNGYPLTGSENERPLTLSQEEVILSAAF